MAVDEAIVNKRPRTAAARVLRVGMVGGGPVGFIGDVHRRAMWLDGHYQVIAGAFSRDKAKCDAFGASLGIAASRLYCNAEDMAAAEALLPAEERIEVAVIVTPTPQHCTGVLAFVSRGFAVVCDKPLCSDSAEADTVLAALAKSKTPFMLVHNYSGFPMVKQARGMVAEGALGAVTKVVVEYEQGWLCESAQLSTTGAISSLADVGTHALQLLQYVSGSSVEALCATVATMVGGARTPDDASVLLRLSGGARGVLLCSQACAGRNNGLRIRVYGTRGGLMWDQEAPERLDYLPVGAPAQTLVRGSPWLCAAAKQASRIPVGHTEGFLEAFANLYSSFYSHVTTGAEGDFPSAEDGQQGLRFVEACVRSSEAEAWVSLQ